MELKRCIPIYFFFSRICLNRTFMELKLRLQLHFLALQVGLNRTFMELKPYNKSPRIETISMS